MTEREIKRERKKRDIHDIVIISKIEKKKQKKIEKKNEKPICLYVIAEN